MGPVSDVFDFQAPLLVWKYLFFHSLLHYWKNGMRFSRHNLQEWNKEPGRCKKAWYICWNLGQKFGQRIIYTNLGLVQHATSILNIKKKSKTRRQYLTLRLQWRTNGKGLFIMHVNPEKVVSAFESSWTQFGAHGNLLVYLINIYKILKLIKYIIRKHDTRFYKSFSAAYHILEHCLCFKYLMDAYFSFLPILYLCL